MGAREGAEAEEEEEADQEKKEAEAEERIRAGGKWENKDRRSIA